MKTRSKDDVREHLKALAGTFKTPDIFVRPAKDQNIEQELNVQVPDWTEVRRQKEHDFIQGYANSLAHNFIPNGSHQILSGDGGHYRPSLRPVAKLLKNKSSKSGSGRTYTSKYRGVHQTFPTRRWEAQFRRSGKPTSLGCFDREDEAARAYDKMMLWCELHNATGVKGGITNFDPTEYEKEIPLLQKVSQDELVAILRSDGRRQAASRSQRVRKDAQPPNTGPPQFNPLAQAGQFYAPSALGLTAGGVTLAGAASVSPSGAEGGAAVDGEEQQPPTATATATTSLAAEDGTGDILQNEEQQQQQQEQQQLQQYPSGSGAAAVLDVLQQQQGGGEGGGPISHAPSTGTDLDGGQSLPLMPVVVGGIGGVAGMTQQEEEELMRETMEANNV